MSFRFGKIKTKATKEIAINNFKKKIDKRKSRSSLRRAQNKRYSLFFGFRKITIALGFSYLKYHTFSSPVRCINISFFFVLYFILLSVDHITSLLSQNTCLIWSEIGIIIELYVQYIMKKKNELKEKRLNN